MDLVISVRFLTSLCKDRSKTAICCCIVKALKFVLLPSLSRADAHVALKASKEAMMLSNRLVVSRAASSLLSWRLAVFIFHCLLVGCLGLPFAWGGLCEDRLPYSWWGLCVLCASRRQQREQTCGCRFAWALALAQEALQLKASALLRALVAAYARTIADAE